MSLDLIIVFHPELGEKGFIHPVRASKTAHEVHHIHIVLDKVKSLLINADVIKCTLIPMNINILKRIVSCHEFLNEKGISTHSISHSKIMARCADILLQSITDATVKQRFTVRCCGKLIRTATFDHYFGLCSVSPVDVALVVVR